MTENQQVKSAADRFGFVLSKADGEWFFSPRGKSKELGYRTRDAEEAISVMATWEAKSMTRRFIANSIDKYVNWIDGCQHMNGILTGLAEASMTIQREARYPLEWKEEEVLPILQAAVRQLEEIIKQRAT